MVQILSSPTERRLSTLPSSPYEWRDGQLIVPVHVLTSPTSARIPVKYGSKVIIEMGVNTVDTVRDGILSNEPFFKEHFVVSFEPLLDKYAVNLATNPTQKQIHRSLLGHHHARGVILPFAVGPDEGFSDFHVSNIDGCSSLLPLIPGAPGTNHECSHAVETRRVPVITLRTVLGWLPPRSEVDYVKCDIQGMDAAAILSAGDQIGRIRRMSIEVPFGRPLNVGAMNCSVALTLLSAHGFRTATAEEMWPYRGIKSKGGGLIYAGGPFTCESAARGHKAVGDLFLIRGDIN